MEAFYAEVQGWVFEALVLPALYALGLAEFADDVYDSMEVVVLGAATILVALAVLAPLERWRPVEQWADRREARVDIVYTLLQRLGLIPLFLFLALGPLFLALQQWLRLRGFSPLQLEELLPPLRDSAVLSFLAYLLVLDFADYWMHRLQHRVGAWWALHALHHSQRQMTFWTDDRNHLLDDMLRYAWFTGVALLVGVPAETFPWLVVTVMLVESLSHANVRLSFGRFGNRLLVSPQYHRVHHAIGFGHEGRARGCNFATLFPLWDIVFRTARFDPVFPATGIRDQLAGADYGEGFWRQQWLGVRRLLAALMPARPRLARDG
ncbi:MAG TPA: sterol desaturase family protein [Pelomicrobium sp.]|nr:sterol desaturase family protein [Pelomicrobium sp.]